MATIQEALAQMGYKAPPFYEPAFEQSEVERSEILHLFVRGLCGMSFTEWASELGMHAGTRVMDKREMRSQDIALTFGFETVISSRMKDTFSREGLTEWDAQPISHKSPQEDRYPPLFHLIATNELPSLEPGADLERIQRKGVEAIFQRGPLQYKRQILQVIDDFNHTKELFGEPEQRSRLLIISQRCMAGSPKGPNQER